MQQADGIPLPIVGTEGVGTYQLRQAPGLVGIGFTHRPHLVQNDWDTGFSDLPGRF